MCVCGVDGVCVCAGLMVCVCMCAGLMVRVCVCGVDGVCVGLRDMLKNIAHF